MNRILCLLILMAAGRMTPTPTPTEAPRLLRSASVRSIAMPTPTPTPPTRMEVRIAPTPITAPEILIENGAVIGVRVHEGGERILPLNPPPVYSIRIEANTSSGVTPVDMSQLFKSAR